VPVVVNKTSRTGRKLVKQTAVVATPAVLSEGVLAGLHATADPLELKSGVALVIDRDSQEVLVSKNPQAVLPIASITKLMTALVVVETGQSMDELIHIEPIDADETNNRRSRLAAGTSLTRGEMLRLALMSSENRAAYALSRHFPGGTDAFVQAMNRKAQALGMKDSRFVEATGLSADNRSSAMDLARLVSAASAHVLIRDYSTAQESVVPVGSQDRATQFRSTNGLIGNPEWDISLQKTGYIAAAGRCLVMQASLAGRRLTMVLLDSAGKYSRIGDAERIRQWLLKDGRVLSSAVSLPKFDTTY
jgi:D-alanyl-D-alanine endopeptidase (penicillin-binding protein 7)